MENSNPEGISSNPESSVDTDVKQDPGEWLSELNTWMDSTSPESAPWSQPASPGGLPPGGTTHPHLHGLAHYLQEMGQPKSEPTTPGPEPAPPVTKTTKSHTSSARGSKKGGSKNKQGSTSAATSGQGGGGDGVVPGAANRWGSKPQSYQMTSAGSLLEEVLNEKKIALMKSPQVMEFLQGLQQDLNDTKQKNDVVHRPSMSDAERRQIMVEARQRHPSGDRFGRMSSEPCRSRHASGEMAGRMRHPSGELSNRRMRYVSGDSAKRAATISNVDSGKPLVPTPAGTIQTRGQTGKLASQLASLSSEPVSEVKTERPSPSDLLDQDQHVVSTDIWSKGASAFTTVMASSAATKVATSTITTTSPTVQDIGS